MSNSEEPHEHSYSWVVIRTAYGNAVDNKGKEHCYKTVYEEDKCACGDVRGNKNHTEGC